ncbi:MAG: hypothetical protein ABI462_04830 [Ignavibacteria bacterium]
MKKNLLALSVLLFTILFISQYSYSQQDKRSQRTPEEMATKMADRMKEKLSLTEDQYKQIYSLALTRSQDKMSNKEKFKTMDKETRKQMKKQNREEFSKQLEGILSKDQLEKMNQNKGKHKHNKGDKKKDKKQTK